ncbi:MAG: phosphoenolpyruvate--protein phosphotransferase [Oscillospiraceae bacterium]|nr:phosphoenolpyruvate--protein phosphotransferase [Oscillospiraceae bacterium]
MITIRGKGVSTGIAAGALYFYHRVKSDVVRERVTDVDAEWRRFRAAQSKAIEELGTLAEKARLKAGKDAALLFETHQMLAKDPDYESAIEEAIRAGTNAEAVVSDVRDRFASMFSAMEDVYMQARAADVRDVSNRIIRILSGVVQGGIDSDTPVILAADDLVPSEAVQLDKSKILGFITEGGSGSSHTSILVRTMGIPAIIGVGDQLKSEYAGREVIIDGDTGIAVLEPDESSRTQMLEKRREQGKTRSQLERLKGAENVTKDGRSVRICCNIGSPEDVRLAVENDGDGIGLFRSEFLYLGCDDFPDEDSQFEAYRQVLSGLGGKEVVIRTLDVGADKQIPYLRLPREENPAMGSRALRICLNRPDIFLTQLRALYRASVYGRLSILFPMITSVWEVREAKKLCEQAKKELTAEGVSYSPDVKLGVMIETPAAAILSDRLAREVDFFSCGTNDLTQYTLACDRQDSELGLFYDPHHPAVLRLLKLVADNAHKSGIRVGVCGDLGADLEMTETFLSIGIDELSVPPRSVLPLRSKVRETDVSACRDRLIKELESDGNAY